ncbi:hypothetical protein O0L34_g12582 [Tuta absoluta]|nr:hypothetical protein O0L34_g12582 [Tuta absoluta]
MSEPPKEVAEPEPPANNAETERKDSKVPPPTGDTERKSSKVPPLAEDQERKSSKVPPPIADQERKSSKVPPPAADQERKSSMDPTAAETERKDSKDSAAAVPVSKVQVMSGTEQYAAAAEPSAVSKVQITGGTDRRESRPSIAIQKTRSLSRLKVRRKSYGFGSVSGIIVQGATRISQLALEFRRPMPTFLPTYQLAPKRPFKEAAVQKVVDTLVDELCPRGYKYNPTDSPKLAMTMALEIMRAVKAMNFDRYKIIAVVTIGQKRSQSYTNTISFIWDGLWDRYVDTHREFTTAIVQVTVFGVYYD